MNRRRSLIAACCLGIFLISEADALVFEPHTDAAGRAYLIIKDGDPIVVDGVEQPDGFRKGDAERLEAILQKQAFYEVQLNSGGGAVETGFAIGRLFRKYQMRVTVPANFSCWSSCTIAFMGGRIRYISPGAEFVIHSPSSYMNLQLSGDDKACVDDSLIKFVACDAKVHYESERYFAARLIAYFQEMFGGNPNTQAIINSVFAGPEQSAYYNQNAINTDAEKIRSGGEAAIQAVLMALERQETLQALHNAKRSADLLGAYAMDAIKVAENMYSSTILSGNDIVDHTQLSANQNLLREFRYINVSN